MGNFQKFLRITGAERALFLEALWQLIRCRILFILLPYAKLEAKFKQHKEASRLEPEEATSVRIAIQRASRLSMWKNACLVQTFAARAMLNKRKLASRAFLGVQPDGSTPDFAHAWIISADIEVVRTYDGYVQVHEF